MEFDKSRVYTALNADELPIGSKCVFADTIQVLKKLVETSVGLERLKLRNVQDDTNTCRFIDKTGTIFAFAYLIEPPAEPKYKPFESIEKAMEAIRKHGGWVKHKNEQYSFITAIDIGEEDGYEIKIDDDWYSADELLKNYVFVDDGSHCGELVEE